MSRYSLLCFFIMPIFAVVLPAFGFEIENAAVMPHQLDLKFIEDIWGEVIKVTNEEAMVLAIDPDLKAPKIIYIAEQPEVPKWAAPINAEIIYYVNKKSLVLEKIEKVSLDRPRVIQVYPAAFKKHFQEWENRPSEIFGELAYGSIAHEFFHETLLQQYVPPEYHHYAMLSRGTLLKVLQFIDRRLGTGTQISDTVIGYAKGQCEKDSGGRIRF